MTSCCRLSFAALGVASGSGSSGKRNSITEKFNLLLCHHRPPKTNTDHHKGRPPHTHTHHHKPIQTTINTYRPQTDHTETLKFFKDSKTVTEESYRSKGNSKSEVYIGVWFQNTTIGCFSKKAVSCCYLFFIFFMLLQTFLFGFFMLFQMLWFGFIFFFFKCFAFNGF